MEGSIVDIVDDDPGIRRGVRRLLKSAGFACRDFCSAEDLLDAPPGDGPRCVVLDVRMPGLSGPELQDALLGQGAGVPIVFLTGRGTLPIGIEAMKKGAVDFLTKPVDDEVLIDAVKRALAKHVQDHVERTQTAAAREKIALLTPREHDVFRLVSAGLLNKQIAYELGISEKTVKVHRGRVMQKLAVQAVADLVRISERAGLESPA